MTQRNRVERYRVELLDNRDNFVKRLKTTSDGTLSWDRTQPIQRSGKIRVIDDGNTNWDSHRLRIWLEVEGQFTWSLGIYIIVSPVFANRGEGRYEFPIEIHDKTIILDQDEIDDVYSVNPYDDLTITEHVQSLITSTNEDNYNISHSTAKVRDSLSWEAGTPKLYIINELLTYINYKPLWVDDEGYFQVSPYNDPLEQAPVRVFERGNKAIHSASWTIERELSGIPNQVILKSTGNEDEPGFRGIARNEDPNSEYSIPVIGRVISHTETVEAETLSVLNDLAKRRLSELSAAYGIVNIDHLVIPFSLGDKVQLISGDVDLQATIDRMDFTLKPGALCSAVWRQVGN